MGADPEPQDVTVDFCGERAIALARFGILIDLRIEAVGVEGLEAGANPCLFSRGKFRDRLLDVFHFGRAANWHDV